MTTSSVLSPLLELFREDANVDFCYSSARPTPCWPDAIPDGTDHQLEDDLRQAFRAAGYPQLSQIGITQLDGRVALQGRVPTYYLKQIAQSLTQSHPGVQVVDNHIEVACVR